MITVYYLPIITINGTEQVVGIDLIHDAILDTTEDPNIRQLMMDTNPQEDQQLLILASDWRYPTAAELHTFNETVIPHPPDPDILRAIELLTTSPPLITMPEIWELLRIFGRKLYIISD